MYSHNIPVGNQVNITKCVSQWTGSYFDFTIHWTVPQFVAYGSEIFSSFRIEADSRSTHKWEDISKVPNQTTYSYKWTDFKPASDQYVFKVNHTSLTLILFSFHLFVSDCHSGVYDMVRFEC